MVALVIACLVVLVGYSQVPVVHMYPTFSLPFFGS